MPTHSTPTPLTSTAELKLLCDKIAGDEFICVDTEFHRERTYYPHLCLIQVASASGQALIDALSPEMDLDPLYKLLFDPNILKVFHAPSQDLEIFVHLTGKVPENCYDTQLAAGVCGYGQSVSLAKLAKALLGETLSKSDQLSNWRQRPLSTSQCKYALSDVTLLRDIYPKLAEEIHKQGRTEWIQNDLKQLSDPSRYIHDSDLAWQRISTARMSEVAFPALLRIAKWWDQTAQELDRPRRFFLREETIKELANVRPSTVEELNNLRTVNPWRMSPKLTSKLLEVIQLAKSDPPCSPPTDKPKKISGVNGDLTRLLRLWLISCTRKHKVTELLVANQSDLEKIAAGITDVPALSGWRAKVFGNDALSITNGEASIGFVNGKMTLLRSTKQ